MSEFYQETKNSTKDYSDRYKKCKVLRDIETSEVLLSTREIVDIPLNANDNYYILDRPQIVRFDVLANQYYNNPLLWWVIAQANGIYDPLLTMKKDTRIRIPAVESLYGNKGILIG